MKVIKLYSLLNPELRFAKEVCIASAIVSDAAIDFLLSEIDDDCKVKLLIGIDLATPETVFEKLLALNNPNIEAKVFTRQGFFHPKLYLVNGKTKSIFIGSGNFTQGGLGGNIELFHKLSDDLSYTEYLTWFNQYYNMGTEITDIWLKEYSLINKDRNEFEAIERTRVADFKRRINKNGSFIDLRDVDFTNQFFKLQHYLAFEGDKPNDRTAKANLERSVVKDRLLDLHDILFPLISNKEWDIHPHSMPQHIVSSFQHGEHTGERLDALWLHYGRSQAELDRFKEIYGEHQTSLYHMRLQVLLRLNDVQVWLRVGKNNGSIVDREAFKKNIKDSTFMNQFFRLITSLPSDFFITINAEHKDVNSFKTASDLYEFVRRDEIAKHYFIIGKEYRPDSPEISESRIAQSVLNDFELLLPLYNLIKTSI
jgi:HKD family nuclease